MVRKNTTSKMFDIAKRMPPLRHSIPGKEFDISESEVAQWLCKQPQIMQYVFNRVGSMKTGLGFITYDSATGTWQGIEYGNQEAGIS